MPVSGWWLPIVMVVGVMPGADAVSALPLPDLPPLDDVDDDDELQAAPARLRAASPATAASLAGCDLIMLFLSLRTRPQRVSLRLMDLASRENAPWIPPGKTSMTTIRTTPYARIGIALLAAGMVWPRLVLSSSR